MLSNAPTAIPKKEFTLDYDIAKVKTALNDIIEAVRPLDTNGFYRNSQGMNPLFGLYSFNIHKQDPIAGLVTGSMDVNIEEMGEQKTKISILAIQKTRGALDASKIMDIQNHFLKLLSARLTGEKTVQELAPPEEGISSISVVLILIIIIILVIGMSS